MRKLVWLLVLVFALWFFFIRPGATEFGCAASGVAHAATDECPSDVETAAGDPHWAADRLAEIRGAKRTTGVLFDDDGDKTTFTSGGGSDADYVDEVLREQGVPRPRADRPHPASTHVEPKAAAYMRDEGISTAVLVINHPQGPCPGDFGCQAALVKILPTGARLTV